MATLDYGRFRNQSVTIDGNAISVGGERFDFNEQLDFGNYGSVHAGQIAQSLSRYQQLTNNSYRPQMAALLFISTGNPYALDFYFPLTSQLPLPAHEQFYMLVRDIMNQPGFDLHVIGPNRSDVTSQVFYDVPYMVAGHLAECFFGRTDILQRFLSTPRHFRLYTDGNAFAQDGGLAGGDYNSSTESIQLVMSRLYEGYNGQTPGVAPFLHELGHMLDFFDAATGRMGGSDGLLPGMSPQDGPLYTPQSRQLFLRGKAIEKQRYENYQNGTARPGDPIPIGHPYIFQNDTEFIAGYFEMFFRNPNYFAEMNPDLYGGFAELLRQDQRQSWPSDFPFYVTENKKAYPVGGQRPSPNHITVPNF